MADSSASRAGRRLVIIDDYEAGWIERARSAPPATAWDILALGVDERWYRARHGAALDALGEHAFLDLSGIAAAIHDAIRDFLVPFIADVPRTRKPDGTWLVDTLEAPSGNGWWYLETSEKSPMRGALVGQLYALGLVRASVDAGHYEEVWLGMRDEAVTAVIRSHAEQLPPLVAAGPSSKGPARGWTWYWLQAARQIADLASFRVLARVSGWRRLKPSGHPVLFFSFFPVWWSSPYAPGALDRFFPELPETDGARPFTRAVWLTESAWRLWARRRDLGAALGRHRFLTLQHYVSLRDAAALLSPGAFLGARRFCRDCARHLSARFAGFDVLPLIVADISRSFTTGELFRNRLLAGALRRMSSVVEPSALVFRMEGQPCDRALTHGVRDRAPAVGFWHVPMDRYYLPLHFGHGAIARAMAGNAATETPVPDRMLVSGSAGRDMLERQGYPRARTAVCGAVRQPALAAYRAAPRDRAMLRTRLGLPHDRPVLFAATSVVRTDSEGLLSALVEALAPLEAFRLIVKLHPALTLDARFLRWVFDRLGPERAALMPGTGSMYDYIAASDAMLVAGSTIAFEAMALDVLPIAFQSPGAFSASSLEDFSSACFVTRTPAELRSAIELTLASAPAALDKRRAAPAAVERVFGPIDRPPVPQLLVALHELGV